MTSQGCMVFKDAQMLTEQNPNRKPNSSGKG